MKTLAQPSSKPLRDFLRTLVRPDATVPGRSGCSAGAQRVVSGLPAGAQREDPTVTFGSVMGD